MITVKENIIGMFNLCIAIASQKDMIYAYSVMIMENTVGMLMIYLEVKINYNHNRLK